MNFQHQGFFFGLKYYYFYVRNCILGLVLTMHAMHTEDRCLKYQNRIQWRFVKNKYLVYSHRRRYKSKRIYFYFFFSIFQPLITRYC